MSNEHPVFSDKLDASGLRIAIVVSRFNRQITDRLLAGAQSALEEHGADPGAIEVYSVPGALEIGTVASALVRHRRPDVLVCLGCVVRGGTAHFEYVCDNAMRLIARIAARGDVGVGNGLLTVDTIVQAQERAGGSHGDKGREAALTALEVARTIQMIRA
ncbi:MAG: 6,7-dimethyl-8-ribityllumazine synthase [Zetaproteobacteria bacterium]|nr:MAG: 6,7-dimethyl-8-ribityllumazine synthase [Zetaproteobacteria bacterium]